MKICKSLKHSVLGICCSLGLSGFAYSQDVLDSNRFLIFPPSITIGSDNSVSIVANNDLPMNLTLFPESSGGIGYEVQIFDQSTGVRIIEFTDSLFFGSTGQQINNLSITTGRGNDNVRISRRNPLTLGLSPINVPITGDLTIDTRNGDDFIVVSDVDVDGRTSIRGRAGNDAVFVGPISADSLYIGVGPGGDEVGITNSVITNRVSFSGGRGSNDGINIGSSNDFRQEPKVVNFEFVAD